MCVTKVQLLLQQQLYQQPMLLLAGKLSACFKLTLRHTLMMTTAAAAAAVSTWQLGHWLGLFHTFQGGCVQGNRGDFIADTPAQQMPNFETCDTNKDSCSALRFPGEFNKKNMETAARSLQTHASQFPPTFVCHPLVPSHVPRYHSACHSLRLLFGPAPVQPKQT